MPSHTTFSTGKDAGDDQHASTDADGSLAASLETEEGLARWADLVASGCVPFPPGLCEEQAIRLMVEVATRRRSRLVRYLAKMIAMDIYQEEQQGSKRSSR